MPTCIIYKGELCYASRMSKKIQKINPSKKIRGVRVVVFCGKCRRDLTKGICHRTKEDHCEFADTHHNYKYYLNRPNGKGERIAKVLKGVKKLEEAQRIAMNDKHELKTQPIELPPPPVKETIKEEEQNKEKDTEEHPLLRDCLLQHIDILSNFNVAPHLQRPRSPDYLADISRGYEYLMDAFKKQGRKLDSYPVTDLNDSEVGIVHNYLLDKEGLNFSNRSYSKYMQYYSTFLDWCIAEKGIGRINYFKKVPKRTTEYKPEVISKEAFEKLIAQITPENGIEITKGKKKQRRSHYKSWLAHALKISLESGRRRPEMINMKMSDIHAEDSVPIYIKVADSKVNNINNFQNSQKRFVYVPVTSGLYALIKDDYEKYLETKKDAYIIAPEITERREEKMCDALTRGFAHYFKQLDLKDSEGNPHELSFGCLRKTFLTSMEIHSKGQTSIVSGHGSGGKIILNKHYIDQKAIASVNTARNFSVFHEENNQRKEELSKLRNEKNVAEKGIEI